MSIVKKQNRRTFTIRPSGRSTDFISPSFGHGCLYNCSYCYMKRNKPYGLSVAKNTEDILTSINNHVAFDDTIKPNQTHSEFITYDISCNEDFALHAKHHEWKKIFTFFRDHPKAMGSFATKYVNRNLLTFDPKGKIRIRYSLMPQKKADIHEPCTSKIIDRIKAVDTFIEAGYDVHVNFSPIIVYNNWLSDYSRLFDLMNEHIKHKKNVLAECIFLTHNFKRHKLNLKYNPLTEVDIWVPHMQEEKESEYGGTNVRYKRNYKYTYIKEFKHLHNSKIPWNKIRYIF